MRRFRIVTIEEIEKSWGFKPALTPNMRKSKHLYFRLRRDGKLLDDTLYEDTDIRKDDEILSSNGPGENESEIDYILRIADEEIVAQINRNK